LVNDDLHMWQGDNWCQVLLQAWLVQGQQGSDTEVEEKA